MSWEGGKPVVTYPIPGVPGAIATATLNDKFMAERVVVKQGSKTTEFTYSDYQDWNNPLNKVDVLYAGKMTERHDGAVVRDLTTTQTETGSVVCGHACAGQREGGDPPWLPSRRRPRRLWKLPVRPRGWQTGTRT